MLALINPNICMQQDDLFGTGIPYMPVELAYTAAFLRSRGVSFKLIDSFGENPAKVSRQGKLLVQGLSDDEIVKRVPRDTTKVIVYCGLVVTFDRIVQIISAVKKAFLDVEIICIENTQQVTSFSLSAASGRLFDAGADILVIGDP